jgi:hypothetical protein
MKLKLIMLCALFAAGVFASLALADGGGHGKKADGCHAVFISGTVAPQTLAVTVSRASDPSIAAGTQLSLAVGSTGQTVRVRALACSTGTGSSLVLTVKHVDLSVRPTETATTQTGTTQTGTTQTGTTQTGTTQTGTTQTGTTQTTTTGKHGDDDHGRKHGDEHHVTTTTATTTAATTTTGTTTTAGTTTTGTTTTHP